MLSSHFTYRGLNSKCPETASRHECQDKPKSYQTTAMLVSLISKTAHRGRHNSPEGCLWNIANTSGPVTYQA